MTHNTVYARPRRLRAWPCRLRRRGPVVYADAAPLSSAAAVGVTSAAAVGVTDQRDRERGGGRRDQCGGTSFGCMA